MVVQQIREIKKQHRANLRKLPSPQSKFSETCRNIASELYIIFQENPDFRQRLAKVFETTCNRPLTEKDKEGVLVLLERLFSLDIPMAFSGIPPYDQSREEEDKIRYQQGYERALAKCMLGSLVRSRNLMRLRGNLPTNIFKDDDIKGELGEMLHSQRIYSFLTYTLRKNLASITALSPVDTRVSTQARSPSPMNTALAVAMSTIMQKNRHFLEHFALDFVRSPVVYSEKANDGWASYQITFNCSEYKRDFYSYSMEETSEDKEEERRLQSLRNGVKRIRRDVLKKQPYTFRELNLEHRVALVPLIPKLV